MAPKSVRCRRLPGVVAQIALGLVATVSHPATRDRAIVAILLVASVLSLERRRPY